MGVEEVRSRIRAACERSGRPADDVVLVGVTKYATVEQAAAVVATGVVDLGENQAQQLRDRAQDPHLAGLGVRWHAIGPLQSNKARYVARWAHAFHALDRASIAATLSGRRVAEGLDPLPCYVQVNVAGEASKAGVAPGEVAGLVDACGGLPGVEVVGLMAMPPLASAAEHSRQWFAMLRELASAQGLAGLSMGTSADFEVAVEEGATVVRIGGGLFE